MGAAVATYLQHCPHPDLGLNPRRVCAALTAVRQLRAEIPYEAMSRSLSTYGDATPRQTFIVATGCMNGSIYGAVGAFSFWHI